MIFHKISVFVSMVGLGFGCGNPYSGPEPVCPDGGTTLTWANTGQPFFEQYCIRCHDSALEDPQRQGATSYINFDSLAIFLEQGTPEEGDLGETWEAVAEEGIMPPNMWIRPTTAEVRDLGEWLACGAPE